MSKMTYFILNLCIIYYASPYIGIAVKNLSSDTFVKINLQKQSRQLKNISTWTLLFKDLKDFPVLEDMVNIFLE